MLGEGTQREPQSLSGWARKLRSGHASRGTPWRARTTSPSSLHLRNLRNPRTHCTVTLTVMECESLPLTPFSTMG